MEVLVNFLIFVGLFWFTLVGVFSLGFTVAAFKAKGPLLRLFFLVMAASPFLYQHIQQSLIQRKIEHRAAFVQALDRTQIVGELPKAMVSLGRLEETYRLRLFEEFGIEDFYIHVKKSPFTTETEFEFVSFRQTKNCDKRPTDKKRATADLWQLEPGLYVCVRSTPQRINREDLPKDALYFLQGEETTFSRGLVGRSKFGPLNGSTQYELRNGKDGPLIDYLESGVEAEGDIFLKTYYSNAHGSFHPWSFLRGALDPQRDYGS